MRIALEALARQFPTAELALAERAALTAQLELPKGVVHVISDIHGDYKKLRHVINNASGSLRTLIKEIFNSALTDEEQNELLAVLYYPQEALERVAANLNSIDERRAWVKTMLRRQFNIVRALAANYRQAEVRANFPVAQRELFEELLTEPCAGRGARYVDCMIDALVEGRGDFHIVRVASHVVRNMSITELICAGDVGDRGARIDKVIDYLQRQPRVRFTWGNHDVSWMGACLGQEALIATVLRLSLRYRRLSQLEEGYGIIISPLERLAQTIYANDAAECFRTKGKGLRDDLVMARMQKAAAIIQFKLEGQLIARHPEWNMDKRRLLHKINFETKTIEIDGRIYDLLDTYLPTLDMENPYALSVEEEECMRRIRQSFIQSGRLWQQMTYLVRHGAMWIVSDDTLIFHACVPMDEAENFIAVEIDGEKYAGKKLFIEFEKIVRRGFARGATMDNSINTDADWLWYLWAHADSPLFGKDRMATFETYFIHDKDAHKERKNPYFEFIHDAEFCRRVLAEFGVSSLDGLIVNGHVPVKIEAGEKPVKRGGNAITIDGAFSEAYGDHGYTLILAADRIALAEHHHFESIAEAINSGSDIVPKITVVRTYERTQRVADTELGASIRVKIEMLEQLARAYQTGLLYERQSTDKSS